MNSLQPKSKGKYPIMNTLHKKPPPGGRPSKRENHPKHISLEGVVAAELGSELGLISLESLPGHGGSRGRADRNPGSQPSPSPPRRPIFPHAPRLAHPTNLKRP